VIEAGAAVFGLVVGFITYRTLVRTSDKTAITDLAAVLGAIGGGAVTKLYDPAGEPFAWYAFGLAGGVLLFFLAFLAMNGKDKAASVMSGGTVVIGTDRPAAGANAPQG
jgi:hypothetical protein